METNILVVGDLHFKEKGIKRYQKMSEEILSRIKESLDSLDAVVLLGDVLHKHESSHQTPFDMANDFIIQVSKMIKVFVIIGNHDYISNTQFLTNKHFFNPLKELDNIVIVDYPTEATIKDLKVALVPYVYPGRFHEALSKLPRNITEYNVIFAHQEINGVNMGKTKSIIGDKWSPEYPLLISGHIHEFQILSHNMIYVGTPIMHNFGDGYDKGIYLFTFDEKDYTMSKVNLDVPLKKIYEMSADEVIDFDLPISVDIKIKIRDTIEAFNSLVKKGIVDELEKKGAIVIHENTVVTKKEHFHQSEEKQNFRKTLYNEIKTDHKLKETFERLFGVVECKGNRKVRVKIIK